MMCLHRCHIGWQCTIVLANNMLAWCGLGTGVRWPLLPQPKAPLPMQVARTTAQGTTTGASGDANLGGNTKLILI